MNEKKKMMTGLGALSAAIAVALGALAAHGLKDKISPEHLQVFETAVKYQFYHSLALILLGVAAFPAEKNMQIVASAFILGIILFSGSLYLLSIRTLLNMDGLKIAGYITPFGGLSFISGWLIFAWKALKS